MLDGFATQETQNAEFLASKIKKVQEHKKETFLVPALGFELGQPHNNNLTIQQQQTEHETTKLFVATSNEANYVT